MRSEVVNSENMMQHSERAGEIRYIYNVAGVQRPLEMKGKVSVVVDSDKLDTKYIGVSVA